MTIKDIARISGCAVSTVSRALNDHPDVSPETKKRIRSIVNEYNYSPNRNAKLLKQSSIRTVTVIVKGSANLFFTPILEQIQFTAGGMGLSVTVNYLDENADELAEAQRICTEQKPLGIIFLGGNVCGFRKGFEHITIPCVLCTAYAGELGFPNLSSVSVNDFEGGRNAAEKLCSLGHRRIGILSGDNRSEGPLEERYRGICSALDAYGIGGHDEMTEICGFSFRSAYEHTARLLASHSDITAVIAMSDIIAVGAVRAVFDSGLKVPGDISVIGFDGLELAQFSTPRITTFRQPADKIAETAVNMLMDMTEHNGAAVHIRLNAEYIQGESTKNIGQRS